ncbi:DUF4900 domain-containing protein [Deinococcus taeanensis]|uniref:DUF4900 domain-containing protein n=1 Tax=Deinococcus taeanensis TaxID=2737050 RepID=UPI001CDBA745|nr:DUF4900 domain-containing protein [Deinococcus taeanensis]UBV42654.1 DUF4900 domain-containing protein [Deinococcus taeanensis]
MTTLVTVLGTCLVIAVLLSMTASVLLGNQRGAADNRLILETQYAAESALARAQATADQFADALNSIVIPPGTQQSTVLSQMGVLCSLPGPVTLPPQVPNLPRTGSRLCNPPGLTGTARDAQLAFLRDNAAKPAGWSDAAWKSHWRAMFGGQNGEVLKRTDASPSTATGTMDTEVQGGLTITELKITPDNKLHLMLQTTPLIATATLTVGSRVVAQRRYSSGGAQTREIVISQPPFSQYQYFVNRRTLPSGGRLVFWDQDTFEGRVHANGTAGSTAPLFWASSVNAGPRFLGRYTSTSTTLEYSTAAQPAASTMFQGGHQLGVAPIALPTNANNQRLATTGILPGHCSDTATCLASTFGPSGTNGVYYARGTSGAPNSATTFGQSGTGGIYVKGNVENLTLSKNGTYQRIEIVQGGVTTRFEQTGPTSWQVYENGALRKTMTGTFNGMIFVDGAIGTAAPAGTGGLKGNGTSDPDIAADTQLTVAASGDIFIKDDLTYTDNPQTEPGARNVLGVYSEGGNVKVNGPLNRDLTIDGTLMAAAAGKGFGTVDYTTRRTTSSVTPKINITGGIIEEQSQGVGTTGTPGNGYSRNLRWDERLASSVTPPFFPTQGQYDAKPDFTDLSQPRTFRAEGM